MRKGIWGLKASELTPEELEWRRRTANIRQKEWWRNNKERFLGKRRSDYKKNKDKINARRRELYKSDKLHREKMARRCSAWYKLNQVSYKKELRDQYAASETHRGRILARNRQWQKNNRHKTAEYAKGRYHKKLKFDAQYVITQRLRHRIRDAIKRSKGVKSDSAKSLCGCSIPELMLHLQGKFKEGMHWNNLGKWHIDHIRPCASFDLTDPEQQKQCFHYTNLQPLWAAENIRKGAKVITPHETYA